MLKQKILSITAGGGTNFEAGYTVASDLYIDIATGDDQKADEEKVC